MVHEQPPLVTSPQYSSSSVHIMSTYLAENTVETAALSAPLLKSLSESIIK